MNIIIVGCGRVGQTLAAQLNEEGNNITVVDVSAESVNDLVSRHDIMGVVGNGATHTVLQEAGIGSADLMIAVTGSDELNLLCCLIAKKEGNCQTIAKVKNPVFSAEAPYLKDELGLAMVINPEHAAASEIARVLRFPSAIKIETFAKGRVELLKFRIPEGSRIIGMSVKEVMIKLGCDILFCTAERGSEAHIVHGDFVFESKDVISIIASPKSASEFFAKIGYKSHSVKKAMIVGAGDTTHYLCDILQKSGISLKIVEKDEDICSDIADKWDDVAVIHGDANDKEILLEEGLEDMGAFVALTGLDEENILLSLYAKSVGDVKIITRINRVDYDDVIKHLDLDTTVYPKAITADMIVRYVRAMKNTMGSNVETLYNVIKGKVEASEFIVRENSPITGVPLAELKFKDNVLIAAILRGKKVIIPRGYDVICPGDNVVIVSGTMALHDICDVLR
ncbi:MAG: Trk system potassium transporter TrkA [Ruminococcaceae bacterium]|nr:Trk system potassium transporter TrkA [Oscillospiraceae bacterium]